MKKARAAVDAGLSAIVCIGETEAQRDQLVALGCDELQGHLFAKPMTAASLALWADTDDEGADAMFRASLFEPTSNAPLES